MVRILRKGNEFEKHEDGKDGKRARGAVALRFNMRRGSSQAATYVASGLFAF